MTTEVVTDEAAAILEEMGHNFSMKTLRLMAYLMRKIVGTLYRKVLVNSRGLDRVSIKVTMFLLMVLKGFPNFILLSIYLFIYLFVYLFIYLFICQAMYS